MKQTGFALHGEDLDDSMLCFSFIEEDTVTVALTESAKYTENKSIVRKKKKY